MSINIGANAWLRPMSPRPRVSASPSLRVPASLRRRVAVPVVHRIGLGGIQIARRLSTRRKEKLKRCTAMETSEANVGLVC